MTRAGLRSVQQIFSNTQSDFSSSSASPSGTRSFLERHGEIQRQPTALEVVEPWRLMRSPFWTITISSPRGGDSSLTFSCGSLSTCKCVRSVQLSMLRRSSAWDASVIYVCLRYLLCLSTAICATYNGSLFLSFLPQLRCLRSNTLFHRKTGARCLRYQQSSLPAFLSITRY